MTTLSNPEADISTSEILIERLHLTPLERRAIFNRLIELDENADVLDEMTRQADEAFQMLDALEDRHDTN